MFRAESLELLARSRRPRLRDRCVDSQNGARAPLLQEHNDTEPADDPDDSIDSDDSGPRLSVTLKEPVGEISALPEPLEAEQTSGRGPPAKPDLLDPVVLRTMPPRVAAFMLYESRDPPPWREEAAGQREEREFFEELGGWCS